MYVIEFYQALMSIILSVNDIQINPTCITVTRKDSVERITPYLHAFLAINNILIRVNRMQHSHNKRLGNDERKIQHDGIEDKRQCDE